MQIADVEKSVINPVKIYYKVENERGMKTITETRKSYLGIKGSVLLASGLMGSLLILFEFI